MTEWYFRYFFSLKRSQVGEVPAANPIHPKKKMDAPGAGDKVHDASAFHGQFIMDIYRIFYLTLWWIREKA